ncbi:MAG: beta-ketoacyl synthase N-terminal-like domain-containing protein, partial [Vicinamibacteria bacterium]
MSETKSSGPAYDGSEIAVVGMAGRFPGAGHLDRFWENLASGVESIRFFTDDELLQAGVPESLLSNPNYVKARPILA